jgi:type IV pilus assembly protein PilX
MVVKNIIIISTSSKLTSSSWAFNRQSGVTLIVALIMLLVMTSLGITTMSGATLQERMAGNSRQQTVARLNAEAALKSAEAYLNALAGVDGNGDVADLSPDEFVVPFDTSRVVGLYRAQAITGGTGVLPLSGALADVTNGAQWDGTNSFDAANLLGIPDMFEISLTALGLGQQTPRYVIEYLGCVDLCDDATAQYFSFRIVAIGWGQGGNASAVLQAMYLSRQ